METDIPATFEEFHCFQLQNLNNKSKSGELKARISNLRKLIGLRIKLFKIR